MTMDLYTHVLFEHSQEEMVKLEKVLEGTMEVSESMVDGQFKKFTQKEKDDNCVYLFQAT
jgi:peptidyl-tRNA hydrolase